MTDTTPPDQNQHGVALCEVTEDTVWPVQTAQFGRMRARVISANHADNQFDIEVSTGYERHEYTVSGDAFRPPVEAVSDSISDDAFAALSPGDDISVYLTGHEQTSRVVVDEVDHDTNRVAVQGECKCQTVSRWVPQSLIWAPTADTDTTTPRDN